ncbi:MAG: hypothetical protein KAW67_09565 [Candidatus Eisenbacteria sp.]|nr:hypothetical protein [Candidatus Eisenbacteria bacterium]
MKEERLAPASGSGAVPAALSLDAEHIDVATGAPGTDSTVAELDPRIYVKIVR